ncbi:translation elongation factor Ts [Psychrobacter sanguinis]|uniref:translation elongation factor Ts n=1 Tax=Psychrobacter sanguinis TaxID=861445 RepID=UPI00020C9371|nr:translation elongation factor Ts [Psychrobacter sanguinis]EGK14547.1 elongation factor EF1B [Psychrobacter sp. 1501(2011)]MCC3308434.1 translation elongation factor Ts [Psychrobacter sanguinis]MCC3346288.1 translation elongation factor Ts [Psychrobacter sanguinis]MCD9150863.1 translation elongation factor Ts [Psychrobacter sanguinis]MDY3307134.1 translation elongation factor Ts [Psychrobacter sanguinis]
MSNISAKLVKELRDRTGLGMMECKKALEETGGDVEQAIDNLRKSGQAKAAKKAGNIAADGAIVIAQEGNKAILVEVNCQTDFVAKDDNFTEFANKVAELALANNTTDVATISELDYGNGQTVEEARVSLVQKIGENIQVRRAQIVEGDNLASYRHGLRIGVVVSTEGGSEETGKSLAMHIAAFNPVAANDTDVPAEVLAREKDIAEAKARESGKPDNIVEKMIEGSLRKYLDEVVLVRQAYVMDNDKKVGDVLKSEGVTVKNFVRFEVGEGIEKKQEDFAAEVAAAQAAAAQ